MWVWVKKDKNDIWVASGDFPHGGHGRTVAEAIGALVIANSKYHEIAQVNLEDGTTQNEFGQSEVERKLGVAELIGVVSQPKFITCYKCGRFFRQELSKCIFCGAEKEGD